MRKRYFILLMICLIISSVIITGCRTADKPQETIQETKEVKEVKEEEKEIKFPTKEITFVLPVTPGGGFDVTARIFAEYYKRHLPGNYPVIVKNVPGGGWNIGIMQAIKARPDGHTIFYSNIPGNAVNQVMGTAEYDLRDIPWLGRMAEEAYMTAVSPHSEFRTLQDLMNAEEVVIGTDAISSTAGVTALIFCQALDIQSKYIFHGGSAPAVLAGIRGDVDLVHFPTGSLKAYLDAGELIPVMFFDDKRLPDFPDVPTIVELGYPELVEQVKLHRLIGVTPGTPEPIIQILRDAFQKTVKDPEFMAAMEKAGQAGEPATAEEAEKIIRESIEQVSLIVDIIKQHQ